jgi:hypothetical protein
MSVSSVFQYTLLEPGDQEKYKMTDGMNGRHLHIPLRELRFLGKQLRNAFSVVQILGI